MIETMASEYTIYHNPRCSKSRKTLELLQQAGEEPNIVQYLDTPPSEAELDNILAKLGREPRDLMRSKEAVFSELGLEDKSLSREVLIAAMAQNPILIERPIVLKGDHAVIGRPPENVLTLID